MVPFNQRSSLFRRLQGITVALAVLLVVEFAGMLLSSQSLLEGLTDLNRINSLSGHIIRASDSYSSARETLEKASSGPDADVAPLHAVNSKGIEQTRNALNDANAIATLPEVKKFLHDAGASLGSFDAVSNQVFSRLPAKSKVEQQELKRDLLLANQYELDAQDAFRRAQVHLKTSSENTFSAIYGKRFQQLYVSLTLAAIFFFLVILAGFSTARRLKTSLDSLLDATDRVATGDLSARPPILHSDEIGLLTAAFGEMTSNLEKSMKAARESADRISRLQAVTAEFSRALEPKAVADAVLQNGAKILGAETGAFMQLTSDGMAIEFLGSLATAPEVLEQFKRIPLTARRPVTECINTGKATFFETLAQLMSSFPEFSPSDSPSRSFAVLPIFSSKGKPTAVLTLGFKHERKFLPDERDFLLALSSLASQALERASLYENAQTAIQFRDEFLSIASHELKTPITSLKLQLQLAQLQVKPEEHLMPPPEKLARMLHVSAMQVDRLCNLVDDLLDVSRIEAGKLSYEFSEVELGELVAGVMERLGDSLKNNGCAVEVICAAPVKISCDRFRVEQVVVNLLTNAMKYGDKKPVVIRISQSAKSATISVSDKGIGIPDNKLSIIFDRFERAIHSNNISGLGLGLYISRQIVLAHHGKISVESTFGKGSTFTVELPIKQMITRTPLSTDYPISI